MVAIGQINRLQVLRQVDFGFYLDGGNSGEILLPRREITKNTNVEPGNWLEVFVYHDSEDRLVATGRQPKAMCGDFAALTVIDINRTGIFLDWGLAKDLFMPHSEERRPLQVGDIVVVHVYQDLYSHRLLASAQLERFVMPVAAEAGYVINDEVRLLIVERTELGYTCLLDEQCLGLLHHYEIFRPVCIGQRMRGYIREVRDDGRVSVSLQMQGQAVRDALSERILAELQARDGVLELSDKSAASEIAAVFGVSKGNYKKAIGALYRQGLIEIEPERIRSR